MLYEIESNPEVKSEFLIFEDDELIIYGDNRLYHLLLETNMIFFDQTFKITIPGFYQTHSLHVLKCGTAFPIIYAIMKKKKVALYEKLFKIVEELTHCEILEFAGYIMSDYELFNMKFFEKGHKSYCWFHTCQSIHRRANTINKIEYNKKKSFYTLSRHLMNLALVKKDRVKKLFDYLNDNFKGPEEILLLEYFRNNYLSNKYNINNWNVHDISIRTNNYLESFNSMLNRMSNVSHPQRKEFESILEKVVQRNYIKYIEVVKKNNPIRKSKKQLTKQSLLYQIMIDEDSYSDADLLNALLKYSPNIKHVYEEEPEEIENQSKEESQMIEIIEIEDEEKSKMNEIIENEEEQMQPDHKNETINELNDVKTIEIEIDEYYMDRENEMFHFENGWNTHIMTEHEKENAKKFEQLYSEKNQVIENEMTPINDTPEKGLDQPNETNKMDEDFETEEYNSDTEIIEDCNDGKEKKHKNKKPEKKEIETKPKQNKKKKKAYQMQKKFSVTKMNKSIRKGKK